MCKHGLNCVNNHNSNYLLRVTLHPESVKEQGVVEMPVLLVTFPAASADNFGSVGTSVLL